MAIVPKEEEVCIREVWADNLEEEIKLIRGIVDDFPYLAMDTEFPGLVVKPFGVPRNSPDYNYQRLRDNVNVLKLIQLGLTFSDESGSLPRCGSGNKSCVWQFNFREFKLGEDVCAQESIDLLKKTGIDFKTHEERGVDSRRFAELMMSSGVVLNESMHWITFHCAFDFGYFLKVLTCKNLPTTETEFLTLVRVYFPDVCDIKYLMKFCNGLHGGLQQLAETLGVKRIGTSHHAGSDSLLTSCVFRKLKNDYFGGDVEVYAGVLYGLGIDSCQPYF